MKVVSIGNEVGQVAAPPARKLEAPTKISENGLEVLRRRYLRKGPDGKPMETVPEMFWRVASNVADQVGSVFFCPLSLKLTLRRQG